jgi:hypothetical protein
MESTSRHDPELRRLRQEITALRSELFSIRMRMSVNAMTFDLALVMIAIGTVFVVAMKPT